MMIRKILLIFSFVLSILVLALFVVGEFCINEKAEMDFQGTTDGVFDHVMHLYYLGQKLLTVCAMLLVASILSWIGWIIVTVKA